MVVPHKRLITKLGAKLAPALRVVAKKAPLSVARRSFGVTKPLSSRLDWRLFSHNIGDSTSANRPHAPVLIANQVNKNIMKTWLDKFKTA